jgi:tripartite-type tricarboxylate transporter receptor subunit TctC
MHGKQLFKALAIMAAALVAVPGAAQDFPNKPVRVVIHLAPGTSTDITTRMVAQGMSRFLNQPVVVENRQGASGMIAFDYVAKQVPADGYTLVTGGSQLASLKLFVKDLRFDPIKDLPQVSFFAEGVLVLAAHSSMPFNTFKELVDYGRANPNKLNWGTSGFTTVASLNTYSMAQRHGLVVTQIPYQGGNALARPALLGNQIQLLWHTTGDYLGDSADKRIKPIIVSSAQRLPVLPDVPTATEVGHPEIVGFYFGLAVPGATPKPVVDRLYASIDAALKQQDVKDLLAKYQMYIIGSTPEATLRKMTELATAYEEIASKLGIKPQ